MCLLTYFPEGVQPNADHLAMGATHNPDGHGYAIVTGKRIIVRHGMSAARVIADFIAARKAHPDGPALFHSRIGTGGTVDKSNCHPFYVNGDHRTVLAHNGIMFRPGKNETRSDTRILAETILPRSNWRKLDSAHQNRRFEKWLGRGNKVLILTVDPRYESNAYLFNASQGEWVGDIWYSNDSYLSYSYGYCAPYVTGGTGGWNWDDDGVPTGWSLGKPAAGSWAVRGSEGAGAVTMGPTRESDTRTTYLDCDECLGRFTVNPVTLYCTLCGTCAECGAHQFDCDCYLPAALRALTPRATDECGDCGMSVDACQCALVDSE